MDRLSNDSSGPSVHKEWLALQLNHLLLFTNDVRFRSRAAKLSVEPIDRAPFVPGHQAVDQRALSRAARADQQGGGEVAADAPEAPVAPEAEPA